MTRLLLVLTLTLALALPAAAGPKNVVLLVADDLGMEVGCYGDKAAKTPNIDALAATGTRFTHGFASASSCSPSRASLLTGMPTHQSGQYGLQHGPHMQQAHAWVMSLPRLLSAVGYFTGIIGKVHVGPASAFNWDAVITKGTGANRDAVLMAQRAREFIKQSGKRPFFLIQAYSDPHRAGAGARNCGRRGFVS